jgi:DNA ligase-1
MSDLKLQETPANGCSERHLLRLLPLVLALAGLMTSATLASAADKVPPLMLAKVYQPGVVLADYWVSEKYDGVRGYWDGRQLLTRGGQRVAAPDWFVANWPATPMDGELWVGRGQFEKTLSVVSQKTPDEAAWRNVRFMVFDLPAHGGPFSDRIPALHALVDQLGQPWTKPVAHNPISSHQSLQKLLMQVVNDGGEGMMLHRGSSLYAGGRSNDLLKVKTHEDSDARVVGHVPGQGKYAGQLGALLVEVPGTKGQPPQRFKLGAGLSDEQRRKPPPIGSVVTYRFRGTTGSGLPRFATFMRVREAVEL